MITEDSFWKGPDSIRRDLTYADEVTEEIKKNATKTVAAVNPILKEYQDATGIELSRVSSGWRPKTVNERTKNAAVLSNHLRGLAVDIEDKTHKFQVWLFKNQASLERHGLYMEHPIATETWAHLQPVPPGSGVRVFFPTAQAAKDWEEYRAANPAGGRYA